MQVLNLRLDLPLLSRSYVHGIYILYPYCRLTSVHKPPLPSLNKRARKSDTHDAQVKSKGDKEKMNWNNCRFNSESNALYHYAKTAAWQKRVLRTVKSFTSNWFNKLISSRSLRRIHKNGQLSFCVCRPQHIYFEQK